jgi:hypothetical protein
MFNSIIERELADSPMVAMFKYVKYILLFHVQSFLQETSACSHGDGSSSPLN